MTKVVPFCKICGVPLLDRFGRCYPSHRYGDNNNEPVARHPQRGGYCIVCGASDKQEKQTKVKRHVTHRPKKCDCGTAPEVVYDCPNDEVYISCPSCGQEGERVSFACIGAKSSKKTLTEDDIWTIGAGRAKRQWAIGSMSREGEQSCRPEA